MFHIWNYCAWITLLLSTFALVNAGFNSQKLNCTKIIVDQSGHGNFSAVQAAIDHIPKHNKDWVCIFIKVGIYREKVIIPKDKPFIMLKGDGMWKTKIVWGDHGRLFHTATLSSFAENFVAIGIGFTNTHNHQIFVINDVSRLPASAILLKGDKASFYKCGFFGLQDTLYDNKGRHYFKDCTIEGAVDFICGDGQSIYERCTISVNAAMLGHNKIGYITAQKRSASKEASGFVFKKCEVSGNGKAYLGRPWGRYSRVLFYQTFLSNVIVPEGWDTWNARPNKEDTTYAELDCFGPGSELSGRVPWVNEMDESTWEKLTSTSFIDAEGWLKEQQSIFNAFLA
ncbi:Pectinesterase, catalytic [Dillenia turbinata]|uniref:Pectinesterase n=1 Tax=Dillenia turbinata TaxID=194707 RepID=A0AAN8UID4_9MAGN